MWTNFFLILSIASIVGGKEDSMHEQLSAQSLVERGMYDTCPTPKQKRLAM